MGTSVETRRSVPHKTLLKLKKMNYESLHECYSSLPLTNNDWKTFDRTTFQFTVWGIYFITEGALSVCAVWS